MTMDRDDQLEKDTVEQLLKYVPTMAERELLTSHAHEMESFARADRFLLEMSRYVLYMCIACVFLMLQSTLSLHTRRVPRYYQRLKSLFFKKTLSDRVEDVRPKIEAVHYSCKELKTSKKLKQVKNYFIVSLSFVMSKKCAKYLSLLCIHVHAGAGGSVGIRKLHEPR